MGIAGLVFGILGAICAFIPFVNMVGWFFALLGIVLSAIGMSKAKKANQSAGAAIAGLVLSIIGFAIALPMFICAVICASAAGAAGTSTLLGL
jgi:hypothetical protein